MHCQYCHQRVSIFKLLSGQPFCSKEHRELYLNTQSKDAIKRLLSSFSEEGEAKRPEAPALTPAQTPAPEPLPSVEVAVVPQELPEPPEASFLLTDVLRPPKSRPTVLISKTVIQPPSVQISFPASPRPEPIPIEPEPVSAEEPTAQEPRLAPLAALEIELEPAKPAEAAPQLAARLEHEHDAPSIVPASAKDAASLHETGLLRLPALDRTADAGVAPADLNPQHLETIPGRPALFSTDEKTAEVSPSDVFAPPPPAPSRAIWPATQEWARLSHIDSVGALRPRSSGPRTPVSSVKLPAAAGLRRADATRQFSHPPAAINTESSIAEASLAPYSLEPCSPGPVAVEQPARSLPASMSLIPAGLPDPAASAERIESPSLSWRLAVGSPCLPEIGTVATTHTRHGSDLFALETLVAASQAPVLEFEPPVPGSTSVLFPREPARFASTLLSLPLSAESLPSPKASTRARAFRTPEADFRPAIPGGWAKAKLPNRASVVIPPSRPSNGRTVAFRLPSQVDGPVQPATGLEHQIQIGAALPGPVAEHEPLFPVAPAATREIGSWSVNWTSATSTAEPLAAGLTLRRTTPAAIPATTNELAALAAFLSVAPAATLVSLPATLCVPPPEPVPTSVSSHFFRMESSPARTALRASANIQPLWRDDALAKADWAGQSSTNRISNLQPSRPSPLSLLSAPRAQSTAAWSTTLAHSQHPKRIPWRLAPGQPVPAQLFGQAHSGRRVGLPHPARPSVSFGLPALLTASPLAVQPLPPDSAGTQQIPIAANRVEPAGLTVSAGLSKFPPVHSATTLHVSGAVFGSANPLVCRPGYLAGADWEIRTPFSAVLPWTAPSAYVPALCQARYHEGLEGRTIAPPPAQPKEVPVESSRLRLARALTSGLRSVFPLHS